MRPINRAFCEALGVSTITELRAIVDRAVESANGPAPLVPVVLSSAARRLGVEPVPVVSRNSSSGSLEEVHGEYRIGLGQSLFAVTADQAVLRGPDELDHLITDHGRFVYAHELAHTLFLVERDGARVRASTIARLEEPDSQAAIRSLLDLEESLCNRFASRLLVPESFVRKHLGSILDGLGVRSDFARWVLSVAGAARVTAVTAFIRLCVFSMEFPTRFFACIVRRGDRKVRSRSGVSLRVQSILFPYVRVLGCRELFPGIAVENLGPSFTKFAELAARSTASPSRAVVPVRIVGVVEQEVRLILRWFHLDTAPTVLVWGEVEEKSLDSQWG